MLSYLPTEGVASGHVDFGTNKTIAQVSTSGDISYPYIQGQYKLLCARYIL